MPSKHRLFILQTTIACIYHRYGVVWCNLVPYGIVQYDMVQCDTTWSRTVWYCYTLSMILHCPPFLAFHLSFRVCIFWGTNQINTAMCPVMPAFVGSPITAVVLLILGTSLHHSLINADFPRLSWNVKWVRYLDRALDPPSLPTRNSPPPPFPLKKCSFFCFVLVSALSIHLCIDPPTNEFHSRRSFGFSRKVMGAIYGEVWRAFEVRVIFNYFHFFCILFFFAKRCTR